MTFGEKLKELREQRGLFQKDLAEHIGVSATTISYYESGRKKPQMDKLNLLAGYFGVTVDYLLGENKELSKLEEDWPEGVQIIRRLNKSRPEVRNMALKILGTLLDEDK